MSTNEVLRLVEEQGNAIVHFRDEVLSKIEAERKEREELEARLNRGMIGSATTRRQDASAELKALALFAKTDDRSELKAMSVGSDPDGGYTVLPVLSDRMTTRLYDLSPMRQLARVETIDAGDAFEEIDDRDEVGATWVGEKESRPATDTPKIGKWIVPVHEIYALQPLTQRLLDDSNRDLGAWIMRKIADKFARSEGEAFIVGDGIQKPKGLLSYQTTTANDFSRTPGQIQYVKTGDASGLPSTDPADVLINLLWALRSPYRRNACWLMNSTTASVIEKVKNGSGDYIWRPSMTSGSPNELLGYPVYIDESMDDFGSNKYPIAFGDFQQAYCIVDKRGIKFLRDPYTDKPNVLFYAYKRVGGGLANDDAVKLLKCVA